MPPVARTALDPAQAAATAMARHRHDPHELLQVLREVQEACGWIPPEAIDCIQARLGLPRSKILGVATFYSFLHIKPCGRYRVLFSDNITDRMLGSEALRSRLCRNLWVEQGKASEDGLVSVATTSCTGLCDQGPALLVNGRAIGRLAEARVDAIADLIRESVPLDEWPAEYFRVDDNIRRRDALLGAVRASGRAPVSRSPPETAPAPPSSARCSRQWTRSNRPSAASGARNWRFATARSARPKWPRACATRKRGCRSHRTA